MRLIDANILVRFAEALDKGEYDPALHAIRKKYLNGKGLKYLVDKCPTVDAAPVVHARWEATEHGYLCSACRDCFLDGYYMTAEAVAEHKYCSKCGAKMDLKEKDHEESNQVD